jgi:hypothetical protein
MESPTCFDKIGIEVAQVQLGVVWERNRHDRTSSPRIITCSLFRNEIRYSVNNNHNNNTADDHDDFNEQMQVVISSSGGATSASLAWLCAELH